MKTGVLPAEHSPLTVSQNLDWDNARIFLEVTRCGSFRAAAIRLGKSVNVVRRRIADFEKQIGAALFTRDVNGTRLTDEGSAVVAAVERMEVATFDLLRARNLVAPTLSGEVRVAITEGLGTFWLAPRLVEFQRAFPNILVDLHCAMRTADVLRHEVDVSIQLSRPTSTDIKIARLGALHIMPFASQSYLDRHGTPRTRAELLKHRLVIQAADHLASKAIFESWFPGVRHDEVVVMRTNVSSANYWAVAKGAGIGLLPTYAPALGGPVIAVDVGMHHPFDIWISYHPTSNRIPRIRHMVDWIVDAFNPRIFPWFRDKFIHPSELIKNYKGKSLVNLLPGFSSKPIE
ncbi:MAG: LysR family transcriptional regulator [Pseudolabrys sp.]